jgi:hypothetical protein
LDGEDHAQGVIDDVEKYADAQLIERNGHVYVYKKCTFEGIYIVGFYEEAHSPILLTEF